jgi:hypothetical protein
MKRFKKSSGKIFSLVVIAALISLMMLAIIPGVMGASAINLGTSNKYLILAKTGVTTTGVTDIRGNIGVSPIDSTAITGFGLIMDASNKFSRSSLVSGGAVYAANYADPTPAHLTTAISDMETAYTSAAGQVPPDATELFGGNLGGHTITPGVYKWSTDVLIPTSTTLTLDAQGDKNAVWVFQVAGDLTMETGSRMVLTNNGTARNVFWQVGGPTSVTLGSGAHAEGIILSSKAIVMQSGASLRGRALVQTAVTMIANTIDLPEMKTGVGVFRPSVHMFVLRKMDKNTTLRWGLTGDLPVSGDWNGDGIRDVGVFRPSMARFYLRNGTRNTTVKWGLTNDLPVAGDWNGDHLFDVGVFRPSTGVFYLKNGTANTTVIFGQASDTPIAGDWNGDGMGDVGVHREAIHRFYLKNGSQTKTFSWGQIGDKPLSGDWNWDGIDEVGVFRPSTQLFLLKNGTRNTTLRWGLSTDIPVSGYWT